VIAVDQTEKTRARGTVPRRHPHPNKKPR